MKRTGVGVAILALSSLAACGDERAALIDDEVYVEAMTRLSWAEIRLINRARLDSVRAAILDSLRLTPQDLVDFSEAHGDDVERFTRLWTRIEAAVDSLAELEREGPPDADSTRAAPAPDSTP